MRNFSKAWSSSDADASRYIARISKVPLASREEVLSIADEVCKFRNSFRRSILRCPGVLLECREMLVAFLRRELRPDWCFELSLRSTLRIEQLRLEVVPVVERMVELQPELANSAEELDAKEVAFIAKRIDEFSVRTNRLRSWYTEGDERSRIADRAWLGFVDAKQRLAATGLRLVVKIAHGYRGKGAFMDLIQDGNEGLLVAAEKFDPAQGCAFTTYASHWIHERISKGIHRRATIRVPFEKSMVVSEVRRELVAASQKVQRPLNAEDRHEVVSEHPIDSTVFDRLCSGVVSLSSLLTHGQDASHRNFDIADSDQQPPENCLAEVMRQLAVSRALGKLDERQKEIVALRFGFDGASPRSRKVIGHQIGLTGERVRQIENETLRILRQELLEFADG